MPQATFKWRNAITNEPVSGAMYVTLNSERIGNWWQASDTTALSVVAQVQYTIPSSGDFTTELPASGHDQFYECWMVQPGRGESLHRFTAPADDFDVFDPRYAYETPDPVQDDRFA